MGESFDYSASVLVLHLLDMRQQEKKKVGILQWGAIDQTSDLQLSFRAERKKCGRPDYAPPKLKEKEREDA